MKCRALTDLGTSGIRTATRGHCTETGCDDCKNVYLVAVCRGKKRPTQLILF